MRRTARQQAPGSPQEFRVFWRDDTIVLDRGVLGPAPSPADVAGPPQPPAAPGRATPCSTRCGARCAASAAASAGARRSTTRCCPTRRSSTSRSPGGRRSTRPQVLGWLRDPEFLSRVADGVARAPRSSGCSPSRGAATARLSVEDVPLLDELRYALGDVPARTEDERDLDDPLAARGRRGHAGADDRRRPRVRPVRAAPGRRPRTGSRTTASPTCSSTRRRT